VYVAGADRVVAWSVTTPQEALTLNVGRGRQGPYTVAFSPDGRLVASGSLGGNVTVWDAATGATVMTFPGQKQVFDVVFSPDGEHLATAVWDGTARVWNLKTGKQVHILKLDKKSLWSDRLAYSPDGKRLAVAHATGTTVYGVDTGAPAWVTEKTGMWVCGVASRPDGRELVTARQDGRVEVWDAETGRSQRFFKMKGRVTTVLWTKDGKHLVTTEGNAVKVRDAVSGEEQLSFLGHNGAVNGMAFNPDETRLATASDDGLVKVWEAKTGQEVLTLKGHTGSVFGVTFSPDGRRIASSGADGTVKIWDGTPLTDTRGQEGKPAGK
jgi:WD40 repeat protein